MQWLPVENEKSLFCGYCRGAACFTLTGQKPGNSCGLRLASAPPSAPDRAAFSPQGKKPSVLGAAADYEPYPGRLLCFLGCLPCPLGVREAAESSAATPAFRTNQKRAAAQLQQPMKVYGRCSLTRQIPRTDRRSWSPCSRRPHTGWDPGRRYRRRW